MGEVRETFANLSAELGRRKSDVTEFESMIERYNMLRLSTDKIETALGNEARSKTAYDTAVQAQNVLQLVARMAVQRTTDVISKITNSVLERLFDDEIFSSPMRVSFELSFTGAKSASSATYNTVTLNVLHRGAKYDGYKLLSGGESDRLSIALTVAMSMLSSSPFLFFDESMASLDENLREKCYTVMKEFTRGKMVVNVCHSSVEGFHDEVVML